MSDKLSDERRERLEFIERCDPVFLIAHLRDNTAFDANALEAVFELAKERARELLAASPAPAIPAADPVTIRDAALEAAAAAVEDHQRAGREWVNGSLWDTLTREAAARIRALKAAPAISESEDARDAARYRWLQRQRAHVWHEIADMPINRTNERIDAAIDAARKGEKS